MQCKNVIKAPNGQDVNCGSCMACRINHTSMWSLRCVYELYDWDCASFVTLTYDKEHVPDNFGLRPADWQTFKEGLRYDLKLQGRKFRYFMCGEYGDDNTKSPVDKKTGQKIRHGRPHFHAIIFGLNPDPYDDENKDRQLIINNWPKCDPHRFDWREKGDNGIDFVNRKDISYVCGYCEKKIKGEPAKDLYGDRIPPYQKQSNGLGLNYFLQNKKQILDRGFCYLNGNKIAIPRYFREKIGETQSTFIKDMKREKIENDNRFLYDEFEQWLQKRGRNFHGLHPQVRERLFSYFYNDHMYTLSRQVEEDFLHRQKLKSRGKL